MSDPASEKKLLRQRIQACRNACPPDRLKEISAHICARLLSDDLYRGADVLLLYSPVRGEPDLLALARAGLRDGKTVCFPRSGTCRRMTFHRVYGLSELTAGRYGIAEPPETAPLPQFTRHSLCLVPGLAFDRAGFRLGYGGGYYDTFLPGFPGITVGGVAAACLVDELPRGEFDCRIHRIVTEEEAFDTGAPV